MRVILIDDEIPTLQYNSHIVSSISSLDIVGTYHLPSVFLEQLDGLEFDMLLCDIELPGINGIELVSRVSEKYPHVFIVFLTAYSDYALKAFRVNAMDYLLKPLKKEDLESFLNKIDKYVLVHKQLKQTQKSKATYFPEFQLIGPSQNTVKWSTVKSKELCAYFLLHKGKTVTKRQIQQALWSDFELYHEDAQFHMTLYRMRKTIQLAKIPIVIHSLPGSKDGYRCESDVVDEVEVLLKQLKKEPLDLVTLNDAMSNLKAPLLSEHRFEWANPIQKEIIARVSLVLDQLDLTDPVARRIYSRLIYLVAFETRLIKKWLETLLAYDKKEAIDAWSTINQMYQYYNIDANESIKEVQALF